MAAMTRPMARELAMRVKFGMSANGRPAKELLDEIFDPEYYATLAEEDPFYNAVPGDKEKLYISRLVLGVWEHNAELDGYIEKYSRGWSFARITRSTVAILKTAMYEILYMEDVPDAAAINSAVEIAKKYEEPETVRFINGILGAFLRAEKTAQP